MKEKFVIDERTVAVADKSGRLAFFILILGIYIDVAVRALLYHQACWDLLALVIGSGLVATAYQRAKRVQTLPRWWWLWIMLMGAVVGAAVAIGSIVMMRAVKP